jgi:leucyl aminopeptidase
MKIEFNSDPKFDCLVIGVAEGFDLQQDLPLNDSAKELIKKIAQMQNFEAKEGQILNLGLSNGDFSYLLLIGVGKLSELNNLSFTKFGGKALSALKNFKLRKASLIVEDRLRNDCAQKIAHIAYGLELKNYNFNKYKSAEKLKDQVVIDTVELICPHFANAQEYFVKELKPVSEAIYFSRNLVSEPPNVIYPESFCQNAQQELTALGVKVEVIGAKEMHNLGMNALLGVGQGSSKESKLLIMQYNGGSKDDAPLAFVGKGVTFDTGGISIKPSAGMEDMKYDMAGAAAVTGLIRALAARKAKVNIVAIAGLVENMPDGNAQRPADVVKSMSGQTIEILNTDAEGRLVLADCLWYCQDRFKPKFMVDLATLTGAISIALGCHYAGLFSNDDELTQKLLQAGNLSEEKLWQLPLGKEYDKMIDSVIADVRNTGNGKGAGSITAAQFLQRFVNKTAWAHLDIASVAWADKDSDIHPQGATGFGIRLLNELVKFYEQ